MGKGKKREASPSVVELESIMQNVQDHIARKLRKEKEPEDSEEKSDSSQDPVIEASELEAEKENQDANKGLEETEDGKSENKMEFAELDQQTLEILGEESAEKNTTEFCFHPKLAVTLKNVLSDGLKKEKKSELLEKYPRKGNCPILTPKLNLEIETSINDTAKKRDKFFVLDQDLCGASISALGSGISMIFNNPVKEVDTAELVEVLVDSSKLMCELYNQLLKARKAYIYPSLDKKVRSTLERTESGEFLFGSELSHKIKSAKAVDKLSLSLKPPVNERKNTFQASSSLNWRGPFSNTRGRQQTGYRYGQYQRNAPFHRSAGANRPGNQPRAQNAQQSNQFPASGATRK